MAKDFQEEAKVEIWLEAQVCLLVFLSQSSPWNPWYPLWYPPLTPTNSFIKEIIVVPNIFYWDCHNPSLGFATKARAYKVAGQERSLGLKLHAPGSARECERIDAHTPKGTPTLGFGVPVDSQMFREQLQGTKPNGLRIFLYH